MKDVYRTIKERGEDEILINKSRFIGYSLPINSEEEALEFIEEIKTKHRDATHNVYAYVFGENSIIQRFSDDGEPSGTAGIPALEVLKKEDLRNIVVVVTRYFGGVKLGGGGLIRAYTKGAKIAIDAGTIVDMTLHTEMKINMDYTYIGAFENFLINKGLKAEDIVYEEDVLFTIYIANSETDKFESDVMDLTSGTASIIYLGEKHLPLLNGKRV